ncbi:MAG: hypothetical protein LBL36_02325 [Clostridiales Family XIII bacterium]|jgi:hypothetical protein|nr:hypothetical protein [Clostridiales Family XIII bacterium]
MEILKILFVIVLCMPILYLGITFTLRLLDNAVANKKRGSRGRKKAR